MPEKPCKVSRVRSQQNAYEFAAYQMKLCNIVTSLKPNFVLEHVPNRIGLARDESN
jgi:hypothetical protein